MKQDNTFMLIRVTWGVKLWGDIVAAFITKGDAMNWIQYNLEQANDLKRSDFKLCYVEKLKEKNKGHS